MPISENNPVNYHYIWILSYQTAGALGDCATDTFSISSTIGTGSPIICGTNTGYHSKYIYNLFQEKEILIFL